VSHPHAIWQAWRRRAISGPRHEQAAAAAPATARAATVTVLAQAAAGRATALRTAVRARARAKRRMLGRRARPSRARRHGALAALSRRAVRRCVHICLVWLPQPATQPPRRSHRALHARARRNVLTARRARDMPGAQPSVARRLHLPVPVRLVPRDARATRLWVCHQRDHTSHHHQESHSNTSRNHSTLTTAHKPF
jgi:hypothetical protein